MSNVSREFSKLLFQRRTYFGWVGLFIVPFLITIAIRLSDGGGPQHGDPDQQGMDFFFNFIESNGLYIAVISLFALAAFLLPLLASMAGSQTVAGEAEKGTLRTVLMQPVRRGALLMAKWFVANIYVAIGLVIVTTLAVAAVAEVGLGLWRTDDGRIKLIVSDRGKGFDPGILRNRRPGEMTFGLFSVQERLMHMGGCMEVDSAPGRGTVVTLWAPAGDRPLSAGGEPPQSPVERGIRAVSHRRRRCRVLIVDDHKIMRDGLKGLLQFESDIEVVGGAADGAEAMALTRELRPDVVIMDVNLGKMTGIDVSRRIKAEIPNTNIIGLSMHLDSQIAEAMKEAGAVAYLSKGGPAEDLIATIRGCASG